MAPTVDGLEQALAIAYRYLNRRERTQAEVRAKLARSRVEGQDAERAIETLVEQGYLDDARFVRLFIQDKRELEGWGSDRIRRALLARGVDAERIEEGLGVPDAAGRQDGGGEIERALTLLRRRFPAPAGDRRERERALGMLVRKGYNLDLALDAIATHTRTTHEL